MSVVHTDMNIPTIPGLQPHPVQIAEQQRIAAMRPEGATDVPEAQRTKSSLMSDQAARRAAQSRAGAAQGRRHRRAAADDVANQHRHYAGQTRRAGRAGAPPNKRADGAAVNEQRRSSLGTPQPQPDGTTPHAVP